MEGSDPQVEVSALPRDWSAWGEVRGEHTWTDGDSWTMYVISWVKWRLSWEVSLAKQQNWLLLWSTDCSSHWPVSFTVCSGPPWLRASAWPLAVTWSGKVLTAQIGFLSTSASNSVVTGWEMAVDRKYLDTSQWELKQRFEMKLGTLAILRSRLYINWKYFPLEYSCKSIWILHKEVCSLSIEQEVPLIV